MSDNVYEFPDRKVIEEEAGAWLVRLDGDEPPTPAEREALHEWLSRSPVHREELVSMARFWNRMNVLTELAVPLGKPYSSPAESKAPARQLLTLPRAIAAAALVVLAVTLAWWSSGDKPARPETNLYATAIGQQRSATLDDGSVIQLNTDSQVKVEYGEHYRDIRLLKGEAFFTVARNGGRPFRVFAGSSRLEAVGTAFAVRMRDKDINVTVTEGRVSVAVLEQHLAALPNAPNMSTTPAKRTSSSKPAEKPVVEKPLGLLEAGQSAIIREIAVEPGHLAQESLETTTLDETELARRLSWRVGLLVFKGESLEEVVREISRYSPTVIELVDPELKTIRIGGQFRVGDIEAMLETLQANFGIRVIRLGYNHIQLAAARD